MGAFQLVRRLGFAEGAGAPVPNKLPAADWPARRILAVSRTQGHRWPPSVTPHGRHPLRQHGRRRAGQRLVRPSLREHHRARPAPRSRQLTGAALPQVPRALRLPKTPSGDWHARRADAAPMAPLWSALQRPGGTRPRTDAQRCLGAIPEARLLSSSDRAALRPVSHWNGGQPT